MDYLDEDEHERWFGTFDVEDEFLLPGVTDFDIESISDGYDDLRINLLVRAYVQLRSMWLC